jgi:purine-binding chemotaxis protein CheW
MQTSTNIKTGLGIKAVAAVVTRNYVTLGIGSEIFAIDVKFVREILGLREIALLPKAPPFVIGVIDVRGNTVPVVDLRLKLGMEPFPITDQTRILVLELTIEGHHATIGLMSDQVFEVAELEGSDIEAPPEVGGEWNSEFIQGISRLRGKFVIIFNLEKLFSVSEIKQVTA